MFAQKEMADIVNWRGWILVRDKNHKKNLSDVFLENVNLWARGGCQSILFDYRGKYV